MAPIGSKKNDPDGKPYVEGSYHYVSHRQDQAVLALLISNYTLGFPSVANVKIVLSDGKDQPLGFGFSSPYFCIRTNRGRGGPVGSTVEKLSDWGKQGEMPANQCQTQVL